MLIRIGTGYVDDEIWFLSAEGVGEGALKGGEVDGIAAVVREGDIEVAGGFGEGEVVLGVNGKSEEVGVCGEDGGGAVPLVDVTVDDGYSFDVGLLVEVAGGDGDIVEDAEARAIIGVGVVGATAEGEGVTILKSGLTSGDGGTDDMLGATDHGG